MKDIEDLLLKALALPAKTHSDRQIKIIALRKAIIKCVIRYDESANPKTKDLLERFDMSINESIAVTSVRKICACVDEKSHRISKYIMKGVCLALDDICSEVSIFPLCGFENEYDARLYKGGLDLNDYGQTANALLNKIYETQAK